MKRSIRHALATAGVLALVSATASQPSLAGSMVKYKITDGAIKASLTGKKGDPAAGKKLAINRKKGNCLACHVISDLKGQLFHGNIGPSLDHVAGRYSEGELRLRLVNPKKENEDTIMPAFYVADGFTRVKKKFQGKTILSAQEVEDVLAYLMTLK